ncbi:MAG: DUF5655 domain-containing protein, partial [Steroidobacteraceae bacterium]
DEQRPAGVDRNARTYSNAIRNVPKNADRNYIASNDRPIFNSLLGSVEFVTRERYVLLRSNRIFTDAVIMSNALRLAIHLPRKADHKLFVKVVSDRKRVTHVAQLHTLDELESLKLLLREAYEHSIS